MILLSDLVDYSFDYQLVDEPFIDLSNSVNVKVDHSRSQIASRSEFFCFVRLTVSRMLEEAAGKLPNGYMILVKEGYRPSQQQEQSFDHVYSIISSKFQELSERELYRKTSEYVAPVTVAGHPTGGAIDVTLVYNGQEINLGTAFNAEPDETGNRTYTAATNISSEALSNRSILVEAMNSVGFINYPTEWWHWSYGDKYWAKMTMNRVHYQSIDSSSIHNLLASVKN